MARIEKFIVLLWMIILLNGLDAIYDQETIDRVLAGELIFFGVRTTFRAIYGDSTITTNNFNPGAELIDEVLARDVPRIDFIPYLLQNERIARINFFSREIHHQLRSLVLSQERNRPFLSIFGEIGSGKTRTLRFLGQSLRESRRNAWTVYVKMVDVLFDADDRITLNDIVRWAVPEQYIKFFENVLELNPSNINFLIDGIDQAYEQFDRVISIVSELNEKGSLVAMTSNNDLTPYLNDGIERLAIQRIPDMQVNEVGKFLYFMCELNRDRNEEWNQYRVKDYIKVISMALEKRPLPRTIEVPVSLFRGSSDVFLSSPLSLYYYMVDPNIQPRQLLGLTKNMRINTLNFYWSIISHFGNTWQYETYAFNRIARAIFGPEHHGLPEEFKPSDVHRCPRLRFENGVPNGFVHPTDQAFYGSKYIMSHLSEQHVVDVLRNIFVNPEYMEIVEFIDAEIYNIRDRNPVIENLMRIVRLPDGTINHIMLDNFIRNGFENLCGEIFKKLERPQLKGYMDTNTVLETSTQYVYGMRIELPPEPVAGPSGVLYESPMTGTKTEIMVKMNMEKSIKAIPLSFRLDPTENLQRLGQITARHGNLEIFERILNRMPNDLLTPEFCGELLYHTIDASGFVNERQIRLLQYNGAVGANVRVSGRTLTHAAIKWGSKSMLEYAVVQLGAPTTDLPDNHGKTPTMIALETNPFPYHTPAGFWELMSYWAEVRQVSAIELNTEELLRFKPEFDSISREYLKLLTDHGPIFIDDAIAEVRLIPLDDIPSNVRELRKNLILKKCVMALQDVGDHVTFPEIIARSRGLDNLSPAEETAYHKTIRTACDKELQPGNQGQARRVTEVIVSNTATHDEVNQVYRTIANHIKPLLPPIVEPQMFQILTSRKSSWMERMWNPTFADLVTQSRADLHPQILPAPELNANNRENPIAFVGPDEDQSDLSGYESCSTDRKRRSIGFRCFYSRKNIDKLTDIHLEQELRIIINVDELMKHVVHLELSGDFVQAKKLVSYAKGVLDNKLNGRAIIGEHQTLFEEILEHGSFREYWENTRFKSGVEEFRQTKPNDNSLVKRFSLPPAQKKIFTATLMAIPFIKSTFDVLLICANSPASKECHYATIMAVVNVGLMVGNHFANKYVYTRINEQWAKRISAVPAGLTGARAELEAQARQELIVAARWVNLGFILIGVLIEIPNIVYNIQTLIDCAKPDAACTSQQIGAASISLGSTAVATGAQVAMAFRASTAAAGVGIGVAIVALTMIDFAINDLIYYHNTYKTNTDEEFRTFWPSLIRMQPPVDVRSLINRTERINALDKHMNEYLNKSGENIVAYAIGIGGFENNKFVVIKGYINMASDDRRHTEGLSRVQPAKNDYRKHLCLLKKVPGAEYEVQSRSHPDAVYECDNAMVIADKTRWENVDKNKEKSFIIYNLGAMDKGEVIGSNRVNNMFQLTDSTAHLKVTGGPSELSNVYVTISPTFHGTIMLSRSSRQEILDMSHIPQTVLLYFFWHHELMGVVLYSNNPYDLFNIVVKNRKSLNLHIIGRTDKPDFFQCTNPSTLFTRQRHSISVDGGGGEEGAWDTVEGCQFSRLRPFTLIRGMSDDTIDIVMIPIEANTKEPTRTVHSTIQPNGAIVALRFSNRPILYNTHSMIYEPTKKTLTWKFYYDDSTLMVLDIMPYYHTVSFGSNQNDSANTTDMQTVTCLFFDDYLDVTIQPIIKTTKDDINHLPIQQYDIHSIIQSSVMNDVRSSYQRIASFINESTSVHLTNNKTKETFIFGSDRNDEILVGKDTKFLYGGEGADVYIIGPESAEFMWINNEDEGGDVDILLMACESVIAEKSLITVTELENLEYDVKLTCTSSQSSRDTFVILQNYLCHDVYRHLIINYNSLYYVILPDKWVDAHDIENEVTLGLFVSYDLMELDTAFVLRDSDTYVVLNVTDKDYDWIALRSRRDVNLALKNDDKMKNSKMIILNNFFTTDHEDEIAPGMLRNLIFIINESITNNITAKVLNASDILNLVKLTDQNTDEDILFKQYTVNAFEKNDTIIDHNNNTVRKSDRKFGVIKVENELPGNFHANWTDDNVLSLCTSEMCIHIKNWCKSVEHRINRMEFHDTFSRPIISVRYMDRLGCDSRSQNDKYTVVQQLNTKFRYAQRRFEFSYDYSKRSQLLRCLSYLHADHITQSVNFKLFGFDSIVDKAEFVQVNCLKLFTLDNFFVHSQKATNEMLRNEIEIYKFSDEGSTEDQRNIDFILKNIDLIPENVWLEFLSFLYYTYHRNAAYVDFRWLKNIHKNEFSSTQC